MNRRLVCCRKPPRASTAAKRGVRRLGKVMTDFQLIVAELSLALAGFSGAVVVMNKQFATVKEASDTQGLIYILLCSGAALVFSLNPFALVSVGLSSATAINGNGICLAIFIAVIGLHAAYSARTNSPRYPVLFWVLLSLGLVFSFLHLASISGVISQMDLYPALLLWLVVVAFIQFSVFIYVQWKQ